MEWSGGQTFQGTIGCQAPESLGQVWIPLFVAGLGSSAPRRIEGLGPRAPLPLDLEQAQVPVVRRHRADGKPLLCQLDGWLQDLQASPGQSHVRVLHCEHRGTVTLILYHPLRELHRIRRRLWQNG